MLLSSSSLRNAVLVLTTLCLVKLTFALPVLLANYSITINAGRRLDGNVDFVSRTRGSDASAVLDREIITDLRELLYKVQPDVQSRSTNALQPREEAQLDACKNHLIKVADAAKQDIKNMLPPNHTRKQYKDAKRWHRALVKNQMKEHRASSATITPLYKKVKGQKIRKGRKGEEIIPSTYKNRAGRTVNGVRKSSISPTFIILTGSNRRNTISTSVKTGVHPAECLHVKCTRAIPVFRIHDKQIGEGVATAALGGAPNHRVGSRLIGTALVAVECNRLLFLSRDPFEESHGLETDVWMLGYLVFQLLTGKQLLTSVGTAADSERCGEIQDVLKASMRWTCPRPSGWKHLD
ncbi:hypothetical protein DFP72DRAFT_845374 [Ephemerocybe angulata]|uniref:Uncharacterized protein n=1 Tax=Ephemerocybe angulata TaxID=980116 RepID=A0A8H6M9I3_9AGAR|nr:hypothetical protein DFP72DRAFT_845374 [Tulosesus angulatus]